MELIFANYSSYTLFVHTTTTTTKGHVLHKQLVEGASPSQMIILLVIGSSRNENLTAHFASELLLSFGYQFLLSKFSYCRSYRPL